MNTLMNKCELLFVINSCIWADSSAGDPVEACPGAVTKGYNDIILEGQVISLISTNPPG